MYRFAPFLFTAVGLAALACHPTDNVPSRNEPSLSVTQQAFKVVLQPIHEQITVEGLSFLKPEVKNLLAVKNASFDLVNAPYAPAHFDNCTFREASLAIRQYQSDAVAHAMEFPPAFSCPTPRILDCSVPAAGAEALTNFARALHPIQDFYAHTNWVEVVGTNQLLDTGLDLYPFLFGGLDRSGVLFADDSFGPGGGFILRPPPNNASYPESVRPQARSLGGPGTTWKPAIVSGITLSGGSSIPTTPNRCPPNDRIYHDQDLAKDEPSSVRMFWDARTLAVRQTTHEWCRFINLVYEKNHSTDDVKFVCDNWVEDPAAANGACPSLPPEAQCCAPGANGVMHTVFLSNPSDLPTGGSTINFETFAAGLLTNPLAIGDATFSAAPGLGIVDVSEYGANGSEVTAKTLIPFAAGSFPQSGYSAVQIEFGTPVRAVGLGWFDPNLPNNWFRVFDVDGNLLAEGQPKTGDSGGDTASFVGAVADCAAIARVEIIPSDGSDWFSIDNVRIVP